MSADPRHGSIGDQRQLHCDRSRRSWHRWRTLWTALALISLVPVLVIIGIALLRQLSAQGSSLVTPAMQRWLALAPTFSPLRWESWALFVGSLIGSAYLSWVAYRRSRYSPLVLTAPHPLVWRPESNHRQRIRRPRLQADILEDCSRFPLVFLTGPSGAGKSTLARALAHDLWEGGIQSGVLWIPIYISAADAQDDWDEHLEFTLREACIRLRSALANQKKQLPTAPNQPGWQRELECLVADCRNQYEAQEIPVHVLFIIDQVDDYMNKFERLFWPMDTTESGNVLLRTEQLLEKNTFWRQLSSLLCDGSHRISHHALLIYRSDINVDVSCFEFPKLPQAPRHRASSVSASEVQAALFSSLLPFVRTHENRGVSSADLNKDHFFSRFFEDLREKGNILPVQIQYYFNGLFHLAQSTALTARAYRRVGGLSGLEGLAIRKSLQRCRSVLQTHGAAAPTELEALALLDLLADEENRPRQPRPSELFSELHQRWGIDLARKTYDERLIAFLEALRQSDVPLLRANLVQRGEFTGAPAVLLHHDYLIHGIRNTLHRKYEPVLDLAQTLSPKRGVDWSKALQKPVRYIGVLGPWKLDLPSSNLRRLCSAVLGKILLALLVTIGVAVAGFIMVFLRWSEQQRLDDYVKKSGPGLGRLIAEPEHLRHDYVRHLRDDSGSVWNWHQGLVAATGFDPERRQRLYEAVLAPYSCDDIFYPPDNQKIPVFQNRMFEKRHKACFEMAYMLTLPFDRLRELAIKLNIGNARYNPWFGRRDDYQCFWSARGSDYSALEMRLDRSLARGLTKWSHSLGRDLQDEYLRHSLLAPYEYRYASLGKCQPETRNAVYQIIANQAADHALKGDDLTDEGIWTLLCDLSAPLESNSVNPELRQQSSERLEQARRRLLTNVFSKATDQQILRFLERARLPLRRVGELFPRDQPVPPAGFHLPSGIAATDALPLMLKRVAPDLAAELALHFYRQGVDSSEGISVQPEYFAALVPFLPSGHRVKLAHQLIEQLALVEKADASFHNWRTGATVLLTNIPAEHAWEFAESILNQVINDLGLEPAKQLPRPALYALCSLVGSTLSALPAERRPDFLRLFWNGYKRLSEFMVSDADRGSDYQLTDSYRNILTQGASQPISDGALEADMPIGALTANPLSEKTRVVTVSWPWSDTINEKEIEEWMNHIAGRVDRSRIDAGTNLANYQIASDVLIFLPPARRLPFFRSHIFGRAVRTPGLPSAWGQLGWRSVVAELCTTAAGQQTLTQMLLTDYAGDPWKGLRALSSFLQVVPVTLLCPGAKTMAADIFRAYLNYVACGDLSLWRGLYLGDEFFALLADVLKNSDIEGRMWLEELWRTQMRHVHFHNTMNIRANFGQDSDYRRNLLHHSFNYTPLWKELAQKSSVKDLAQFVDGKLPSQAELRAMSEEQRSELQAVVARILPTLPDSDLAKARNDFCADLIEDSRWSHELRKECVRHLSSERRRAALLAIYCSLAGQRCSSDEQRQRRDLPVFTQAETLELVPLFPEEFPRRGSPWMQRWLDLVRSPAVGEFVRAAVLRRIAGILKAHGSQLDEDAAQDPWQLIPWARREGFDVDSALE